VTVSSSIVSELQQVLTYVAYRLDKLEATLATKAELEASLARLNNAVTSKVQAVSTQLTAMQGTLNDFVAADATEDASYQAEIAALKAQLSSQLDEAVAAVDAMAAAVSGPAPA
jgi:peptidoglycan hydrolase CwlO-like protein